MLHLRATARFLIPAFATAIAVTIIYAAMAPAGQPAPGGVGGDSGPRVDNWVTNSSLDADSSGWRSHVSGDSGSRALWDPHGGRGGTAALYLSSVRRDTLHNDSSAPFWFFVLDSVPVGRRMHFQAWVRGRDCTSEPVLAVQVQSAMRILLSGASTEWKSGLSGTFDWTRLEGAVDIPGGSARARVMAALVGRGEVWFDDFSLTDLAPLSPEERSASRSVAPGLPAAADSGYLFLVRSEERIFTARTRSSSPAGASSVRMQISLPLADRHQVPISFELWTEPRRSLVSGALREDSAGGCFADLVLEPPVWTNSILRKQDRADGILLKWSAQVMVAPESLTLIPTHATLPAVWPAEARPWLRPTRCVQSDDPKITAVARGLRAGTDDVLEIIRRTLAYMERLQGDLVGRAEVFDAVSALSIEGSCVSRGNLAAALLRANSIPTRLLSGFLTWPVTQDVHFVAEAWVPGYGWYRFDPSGFVAPWPASGLINISIIPPEFEDRGAVRRPASVLCLPYFSVEEFPDSCNECSVIGTIDPALGAGRLVTRLKSYGPEIGPERWQGALAKARDQWRRWVASHPQPDSNGHLRTPIDRVQLSKLLNP